LLAFKRVSQKFAGLYLGREVNRIHLPLLVVLNADYIDDGRLDLREDRDVDLPLPHPGDVVQKHDEVTQKTLALYEILVVGALFLTIGAGHLLVRRDILVSLG